MVTSKKQNTTNIDLELAKAALPKTISSEILEKIDLLNFSLMQKSLISFFNDDQDEMFDFYDNRLKQRLNLLKVQSQSNLDLGKELFISAEDIYDFVNWEEKFRIQFFNQQPQHQVSKQFKMVLESDEEGTSDQADQQAQQEKESDFEIPFSDQLSVANIPANKSIQILKNFYHAEPSFRERLGGFNPQSFGRQSSSQLSIKKNTNKRYQQNLESSINKSAEMSQGKMLNIFQDQQMTKKSLFCKNNEANKQQKTLITQQNKINSDDQVQQVTTTQYEYNNYLPMNPLFDEELKFSDSKRSTCSLDEFNYHRNMVDTSRINPQN